MPTPNVTQTNWNLKLLFKSDNDPAMAERQNQAENKIQEFVNKWKNRQDYLENPAVLRQSLDEYEHLKREYGTDGDVGYYFWLRTMQNETDPDLKAKYGKIQDFSNRMENTIQFFELNIAKVPREKQEEFLADPCLSDYKHFLEKLFLASKHLLSEPEEKIMTLKGSIAYENWVRMTSSFLTKEDREVVTETGREEKKTFSEISDLMNSANKQVRDSAAAAFNDILSKHAEVAENELNSILKNKQIDDEIRGFPRPDTVRHLSDDIDSEVVDALVESVSSRFDISRRYYELKTRLMGVPKLSYHERNVPYGKLDKEYSYNEAVELVYRVINGLDSQFGELFTGFVEEGRIDAFPNKGKHSGAFCVHHSLKSPVYILLNYTGRLREILTLAHELGHGINNEMIKLKQNALNFSTPTSTAEVASTFMEDFILRELSKEADEELQMALNMSALNDEVSTIFRQVACYKLEQDLHNKFRELGYLSRETIGKIFQKNMADYMGDAVEQSPGSENWWVYWSHIRAYFYVYSYASGLLISKSLQNSVRENPDFMEKVKIFLSAGSSDSPKNIFANLGINITDKKFWDKGLGEVEELLEKTERLAKQLGKT